MFGDHLRYIHTGVINLKATKKKNHDQRNVIDLMYSIEKKPIIQ